MSSYNDDDEDECDSSFLYRQRQALKISHDIISNRKENEDKIKHIEKYDDEPLNLSLKPRSSDHYLFNKSNEQEKPKVIKEETHEVNKENINELSFTKDEDEDIKKDLNIPNFGNLSPEHNDSYGDESDSCSRPLSSFLPASLLHNMLVTHTKPPYSYSCLIFMSIESSTRKKLTVKEIYSWILSNFPYFRGIPSGSWKNSIRHNLSHNKCFKKVDKNLLAYRDFSGKGSLWCVNPECRMVLIETLKKMPQRAYSILEDVPESLTIHGYKATNLKSPKR